MSFRNDCVSLGILQKKYSKLILCAVERFSNVKVCCFIVLYKISFVGKKMLFIFFSCAFLIHSIEEIIHEDTSVDYVSGLVDEIMVEEPSEEFTEEISYNDNYEDFVVDNDECNLVYLLDQKSEDRPELWQYDLHTGNLEYQADIQCSRNGIYEHMQSMTGDNDGNLWMLSWQGNLFRFSTETMECQYVNTHSLRIHPDFYPTAITLATKNQQDNQEFYLSGYLWGEDNIEIVIAKLTYYDLYFISSFATLYSSSNTVISRNCANKSFFSTWLLSINPVLLFCSDRAVRTKSS